MGTKATYMPPGFCIKAELKSRKITQKEFAARIGMLPSHLSEIVKGRRRITKPIAGKFEEELNIPVADWLQKQAAYDYYIKSKEAGESEEVRAEEQLKEFDAIYDMHTIYKYVNITKASASTRLSFCKEKLHFSIPEEQKDQVLGYFHKSEKTGLDTRMIATWSVLAKYEASQEPLPQNKFDKKKCDELAANLSEVFHNNHNTINGVKRTFCQYGVKFCIVPKVPHASIDGYSFYIDGVPCVVVTKRFNRIDNFAFAVLHEVGHLKLHLSPTSMGKISLVNPDEDTLSQEEEEANKYAANALIPEELWESVPPMKLNPYYIQNKLTTWAKQKGINKWIALGRVSHETNIYMFKSDPSREIQ